MSSKKNCGCGQDPCKTYGAETLDREETWKNREDISYFFVMEQDERGIYGQKPYRTKEDAIQAGEKPDEIYEYRGLNSLSKEEREAQKKEGREWREREIQGEFFEDFWWKNEMGRYGNSDYERLHHSLYDSSTENDEKDGFYAMTILPSNPSENEQVYNQSYAQELGISERLGALLNSSRSFGMYISQRAHPDTVKKYRQKILGGFDSYKPQSEKEKKIVEMVRENMATRGVKGPSPSYWSSSQGMLRKPELNYAYDDYYDNPIPFMGYELTDEEKKIIDDVKNAETFEASGCVGCQMQKPVSKEERVAIQKQVDKFNEQLALDPDDDFERYVLIDLDDETLIEDAFFSRQGAWKPLTEAFRKRWGNRSELMDKISLAQVGEKSNYSIYSFEKPFWFEFECDPQDTATAEDPEGYGLGFEFDMTKEEAIEKARQIHKETKGAITMYNTARKRSGGGATRIHPKFWTTPEMMEEQKEYYKREDMEWPTGEWLDTAGKFNAETFEDDYEHECMNCGEGIEDEASALKMGYEMLCYPCQHEYTDEELKDSLKSYGAENENLRLLRKGSKGYGHGDFAKWTPTNFERLAVCDICFVNKLMKWGAETFSKSEIK